MQFYITDDGIRLNAKLDMPEGHGKKCPLVIVIHGFTGHMEERHIIAVAETLNSPPAAELPIRVFYNSVGNADSFYSLHWNHYFDLTARCDGLTEGENAVFTTLRNLPHTYAAWSLGLYNFLPLLFSTY